MLPGVAGHVNIGEMVTFIMPVVNGETVVISVPVMFGTMAGIDCMVVAAVVDLVIVAEEVVTEVPSQPVKIRHPAKITATAKYFTLIFLTLLILIIACGWINNNKILTYVKQKILLCQEFA
jgi:hypothetical protein